MNYEVFTAKELARRLTHPTPIDHGLASGVFVQVALPQEGAQFMRDLAVELECDGVRVFKEHACDMLPPDALALLTSKFKALDLERNKRLDSVMGETLADVVARTLHPHGIVVALLIEGVQALLGSPGERILKALKAARDAGNLHPSHSGRFLLVAACTLPADIELFVLDRGNAFYGATAMTICNK